MPRSSILPILALVLTLAAAACSEQQRSDLGTEVAQAGATAVAQGVEAGRTAAAEAIATGVDAAKTAAAEAAADGVEAAKTAAADGVEAGKTAVAEGRRAVETQVARREQGRRVLVLLQGLGSSSEAPSGANATEYCTWFDLRLALPLAANGGIHDDVILFSYAGPDRGYNAEDTFQSIDESVDALRETIEAYLERPGNELSVFDLVGHSLGGVVAWRFATTWGANPKNVPALYHVATVHSPINGSSLLATYHGSDPVRRAPALDEDALRGAWGAAIDGRSALDLAAMAEEPGLRTTNTALAGVLKALGIRVRTFASTADALVPAADATLLGFDHIDDFGSGRLVTTCATSPAPQLDASSAVGHNQLLHRGEGLVALKSFLEE
jgi:pimeloyl-ACP methyl ester carboxylesterase